MSTFLNRLSKLLVEAEKSRELVSIYLRPAESSTFNVGVVLSISRTHFLLGELDEFGREDGCMVATLEDVLKVELGDSYLRRMQYLFESNLRNAHITNAWGDVKMDAKVGGFTGYSSVLEKSKMAGTIVTLHGDDGTSESGIVTEASDEFALLKVISRDGVEGGIALVDLSTVYKVSYNNSLERSLTTLMQGTR